MYRPDIGGLLPLYVADRYEGTEARPFPELTDDELSAYVDANVAAVREVVARARPDVALANHLVMGPAILARALGDVPYAVKIHGSALEYVVKPYPRFRPYAVEGLAGARGVLVGSRHTAESLWTEMDDASLPGRTRLGPPGVDVARFAPREPDAARAGLAALRERLAGAAPVAATGSSFDRDVREAVTALDTIEEGDRLVVFVGKLIASKGVELLLAAWPLVLAREPRARLIVVGFGAFRPGLERLAAQLAEGDVAAAAQTRGEDGRELPQLAAFLQDADVSGARSTAWRSPAGSTTTSSPTCSPRPTRWRSRARSRRHSGWSPPKPPPAARCRSWPTTPASARSPGRSPPRSRPRLRPWLSFEVGPDAVPQLADALVRLARRPRRPARCHPRGDGRDHPRPLLLGRRRRHHHRRRPGRPHRPPRANLKGPGPFRFAMKRS